MPTRLLRENILTSDRVDKLSAEAEVFYRRLMSKVDDHGLFDARPAVLRAALYPLRLELTTVNNCEQLLTECVNADLIQLYQVDGKPYLKMLDTKWKIRSEPKFPAPVNSCKQLQTPVPLVVDVVRSRLVEDVDVKSPLKRFPEKKQSDPADIERNRAIAAAAGRGDTDGARRLRDGAA